MRYIIHGAGAVGCLVGGLLADQGAEVVFIARPPQAAALNQNGLKIHFAADSGRPDRHITGLRAVTSPIEVEPRADDVLMLCVKGAQTAASVHALRDVFGQQTPLFCLQNGVRNEELAAERFLHVYGAMIGLSVTLLEPGVIAQTVNNYISVGNYPLGCDETALAVARDLERAGFDVTTPRHVMSVKWVKLVLNLANALLAITDCHLQLARAEPLYSLTMAEIYEEGQRVLAAAGISLDEPDNPFPLSKVIALHRRVGQSPPNREAIEAARNIPEPLRTRVSTWVDLKEQRGETEVRFFNGEIILLGEKFGLPTPYNSTLQDCVEQMAAEGTKPGKHTIEELREMVAQRQAAEANKTDAESPL